MDSSESNFVYGTFPFAEPIPMHEDCLAVGWNLPSVQPGEDTTEEPRLERCRPFSGVDYSNPCPFSPLQLSNTSDLMPNPEISACWIQQSQVCSTATSTCPSSRGHQPLSSELMDWTGTCPSPAGATPLSSELMNGTRPLGLNLRKSLSFLALIQKKLDQNGKCSVSEQGMEENTKAKGPALVDSQQDKLKASNFSACHLKIGKWECSSVHDGHLVAKCYYAKRKLVWEVLDNGLKNKIEIQWADITGLKANIPKNGPSSLHIEISRVPLFFRETNPQPRKHTIWQPASDFTRGQASIYCRHLLQFSEGVLNRHFDKLVQCDQRLKDLSEQIMPFSRSPFFECQILTPDRHQHSQFLYTRDIPSIFPLSSLRNEVLIPFNHGGDIIAKQSNVLAIEQPGKMGSTEAQPFSPSSVMDSRANEECSNSDTDDLCAKDFTRHAGYNQTGATALCHQRFWYGDRLVVSTMGISPAFGSNRTWSHGTLLECKVSDGQVVLTKNDGSSSEKNFLWEFSHHLSDDTLHENILPSGQVSGQFAQEMEANIQQRQALPCFPCEQNRIVNALTHCPSNRSYALGLSQNLGMPLAVNEAGKSCEFSHTSVKVENYVSSQPNHKDFFVPGNTCLEGGPGIISHSSLQDSWDMPQVGSLPNFFELVPK